MIIQKETLERMAALARLDLSPAESEQLAGELETVVRYMNALAQLPAEAPQEAECPLHNVFREDRIVPGGNRADLLANAPQTVGGCLSVPKTVG